VNLTINPVNDPPDIPTAVRPDDNETLPPGDVSLEASAFNDIDGDDPLQIHWKVRRMDQMAYFIEASTNDITEYTVVGLDEGLKYAWQVEHQDPDGLTSRSQEYTFKVGTSEADSTVQIESGLEMTNFKMVSFVQWPDNPLAVNAFGDAIVENYEYNYRIGTYDPVDGGYIEYGQGLTIKPGKAYWMVAREGVNPIIDGVPVSTTVPIYVSLGYHSNTQRGWNMIGCPNEMNYLWDEVELIEYNNNGDIIGPNIDDVIGPATISNLSDPNDYIDMRLWRWKNGSYMSDTAVMEAYEGYWVKVKKPNIYLCFTVAAQTELTNEDVLPPAALTILDSEDSPPWPMGVADNSDMKEGSGGCFIDIAADSSDNRGAMTTIIFIFLKLAFMCGAIGAVFHMSRR